MSSLNLHYPKLVWCKCAHTIVFFHQPKLCHAQIPTLGFFSLLWLRSGCRNHAVRAFPGLFFFFGSGWRSGCRFYAVRAFPPLVFFILGLRDSTFGKVIPKLGFVTLFHLPWVQYCTWGLDILIVSRYHMNVCKFKRNGCCIHHSNK